MSRYYPYPRYCGAEPVADGLMGALYNDLALRSCIQDIAWEGDKVKSIMYASSCRLSRCMHEPNVCSMVVTDGSVSALVDATVEDIEGRYEFIDELGSGAV